MNKKAEKKQDPGKAEKKAPEQQPQSQTPPPAPNPGTQITKTEKLKQIIERDDVKERFQRMMGQNATSFLLSMLNTVQNNWQLQKCDPNSVLMAGAVAATLDLPVDPTFGMAYIIPYGNKAQFQIGYKGLVELGHRSQQFDDLNAEDVREGEFLGIDRLTGKIRFNWIQDNDERETKKIIGFVSYFSLINGFSKSFFMTNQQVHKHAKRYSKAFSKPDAPWNTNFEAMAKKTVLKLNLDKWAPKSVQMRKAIKADQAIVHDWDGNLLTYDDNPGSSKPVDVEQLNADRQRKSAIDHIKNSTTVEQLETVYEHIPDDEVRNLYDEKLNELNSKK